MHFEKNLLYHIYNRGNNKQQIFFAPDNYIFFLQKMHLFIKPRCDILAWCLIPNHFHFLVHATENSITQTPNSNTPMQHLSDGIRLLLSSYTKAINVNQQRTGNLFQQKTKSKCLNDGSEFYGLIAFHYIHQNPLRAGLVKRMEDWEFSSFPDYLGTRKGSLCDMPLAARILGLDMKRFFEESYGMVNEENTRMIF